MLLMPKKIKSIEYLIATLLKSKKVVTNKMKPKIKERAFLFIMGMKESAIL